MLPSSEGLSFLRLNWVLVADFLRTGDRTWRFCFRLPNPQRPSVVLNYWHKTGKEGNVRTRESSTVCYSTVLLSVSGGNFPREMGNLSMLNLSDNWAANVSGMGTQGLLAGGATGGMGMSQSMGSQYPGMWMPSAVGNLGNVSQSCAMPYLRSPPGAYSLPASGPSSSSSPTSSLGGSLQTSGGVPGQPGCEHPYDLGAYSAATARDPSRGSWSPLTPPPL